MILAKLLLSVLLVIVSFVSYLYGLKLFGIFKFSFGVNIIVIIAILLTLSILAVLGVYISKIRKYDISRLDSKEVESISRFLSFVPFFFVIVSVLFVFSVSAYEYRIHKNLSNFVNIIIFSLPMGVMSYYLTKIPLYEIRFWGFGVFNRNRFVSVFYSFIFLLFLHSIVGLVGVVVSSFYAKKSLMVVVYVISFSFVFSVIIFMWNLVSRIRYVLNILKAPDVFKDTIPVLSNDEIGLFSVYLDAFSEKYYGGIGFPEVYVGDRKVRIELGKQFCGCVWIKLFDIRYAFSEFSEKIMDEIQITFSRIESKAIETRGYVAKFDGIEMIILWGLDGADWIENLVSFVNSILSIYRENILDSISTFKMGVAGGRVFVGKVESINGNLPYFFGECIVESYVVGKYPKGDGIYVSGDIRDVFSNSKFVDKVKVKELEKIVEIYKLLI